jgi:hypothetical protein
MQLLAAHGCSAAVRTYCSLLLLLLSLLLLLLQARYILGYRVSKHAQQPEPDLTQQLWWQ